MLAVARLAMQHNKCCTYCNTSSIVYSLPKEAANQIKSGAGLAREEVLLMMKELHSNISFSILALAFIWSYVNMATQSRNLFSF